MAGVRLVLQFTAESAQEADKQVEAMTERCRKAQQEDGCIQFEVFRSALQPEKYALLGTGPARKPLRITESAEWRLRIRI